MYLLSILINVLTSPHTLLSQEAINVWLLIVDSITALPYYITLFYDKIFQDLTIRVST